MKQGKPLITFVILLFAAALACYFAYYVWGTFQDPITTAYVYEYELNDSLEAEGLLVRSEQVLPGGQGILDVTRGEGEQVGVGQTVALVYRDDQAQQNQAQQEALRLEITQLRYAIGQSGDINSVARVNEEILQGLVALRASSALGGPVRPAQRLDRPVSGPSEPEQQRRDPDHRIHACGVRAHLLQDPVQRIHLLHAHCDHGHTFPGHHDPELHPDKPYGYSQHTGCRDHSEYRECVDVLLHQAACERHSKGFLRGCGG